MQLDVLLEQLRNSPGIRSKLAIQTTAKQLHQSFDSPYPNGDDTAVIPNGNSYDLLACEGFLRDFIATDPWFAGWCGVMVNLSDIAAMGGSAIAIVNAFWRGADANSDQVLQGMSAASQAYQVPIVGGHTNAHEPHSRLAVSVLGRSQHILSSFNAAEDDVLIAAIDLRGEYREPFLNWNAATTAPPERLRADLQLLPQLAEKGLASACKDISQAGLLGTATMLGESSGIGFEIELEKIPKPPHISWHSWLQSFPSFGYLLCCKPDNAEEIIEMFQHRDIDAAQIGTATFHQDIIVRHQNQFARFLSTRNFTGFKKPVSKPVIDKSA